MDWYTAKMQLGGPNKVVLVDESFLTRRKRNKGGFRGRTTQGHLTVIFGAVEMTKNEDGTHKETGRAILRVIPNKETLTLARIIEKNILAGCADLPFGPRRVARQTCSRLRHQWFHCKRSAALLLRQLLRLVFLFVLAWPRPQESVPTATLGAFIALQRKVPDLTFGAVHSF